MSSENVPFKSGYVAIAGKPNVGKSTLLNNLLNFKVSSVTRKPQTTRHIIRGILNGENHQIVFVDTPGLLQPKYKLQEVMLKGALKALQEADLALYMIEAKPKHDGEDEAHLQKILDYNQKVILVINKIDRLPSEQVLPLIDSYSKNYALQKIIPVSALKRNGLDLLKTEVLTDLPEGVPFYETDQIVDQPERFIVSEIIREKIFLRFSDEIPYSTSVEIEEFKERKKSKDFIRAVIYVEKSSQKGIIIGKKGSALKEIGQSARRDILEILDRDVFLELWVKVKEKWRQDEAVLKGFGYMG